MIKKIVIYIQLMFFNNHAFKNLVILLLIIHMCQDASLVAIEKTCA